MTEIVAWLYEDSLPPEYPYAAMFQYSRVDGVRMFPVFAPAPDYSKAMRMAVNSLVSLMNAHFPLERELLTDEQFFAAGDAVAALEKALGERE